MSKSFVGMDDYERLILGEETFAVVELMGHSKVAGLIRRVGSGSLQFLEVRTPDLPEIEGYERDDKPERLYNLAQGYVWRSVRVTAKPVPARSGETRLLSNGAIYCVRLCTEDEVIEAEKERLCHYAQPERTYGDTVPPPGDAAISTSNTTTPETENEEDDDANPFD